MKPWKYTDEQLRDALESHRADLDEWQVTFRDGISEAIASRHPLSDGQRAKAIEIIDHRSSAVDDDAEWEDESEWEEEWERG